VISARLGLVVALAVALGGAATAQIAILQIQVVEGEGSVHGAGAHAARFLTVEVTDESGGPVEGAAVTFHLPEEGPSGTFANGLRTDVATTDTHGRATVRAVTLNRTSGRFQVRVVAAKEQARAGIISFQYIVEPAGGAPVIAKAGHSHLGRWLAIAALAGAGAAGGILAGGHGSTAATAPPPAPPVPSPATTIGTPTVKVGTP
jgi:hypothetical protein